MRKKILTAISAVFVLCVCVGAAWGYISDDEFIKDPSSSRTGMYYMKYQMDDVYGNSGSRGQWIAVLASQDLYIDQNSQEHPNTEFHATRGGRNAALPIKVEGNQLSFYNNPVYSYNGWRTTDYRTVTSPVQNDAHEGEAKKWIMPVKHFFMVVPEQTDRLWVDYRWGKEHYHWNNRPGDNEQATTLDVRLGDDGYYATKTPARNPIATDPLTNRYSFDLTKTRDDNRYSTLRTYLSFHQNPNTTPSQTLNVPLVIANVAMGDASAKPLEFTAVIRERNDNTGAEGALVASNRFTWDAVNNKVVTLDASSNGWILLEQNEHAYEPTPIKNYDITVDIRNYCGLRYMLQRYDRFGDGTDVTYEPVTKWLMDLPSDVTDVDPELVLNQLSHIAPGLITRYSMKNFRINSTEQKVLRLYASDGTGSGSSPRDLSLRFESLGGVPIGAAGIVTSGKVQPFSYSYHASNFLTSDATIRTMKLNQPISRDVILKLGIPQASDYASIGDGEGIRGITNGFGNADQVASAKIDIVQPARFQRYTLDSDVAATATEQLVGMLPVLVTFHVNRGHRWLEESLWTRFLAKWRTDGDIKEMFREHYHLFAKADDSARADNAAYRDYDVTHFMLNTVNAQRVNGTPITDRRQMFDNCVKVILDEERERITVSFIAMLSDSYMMSYGVINDSTNTGERNFLAVLDGTANNRWDMTFYLKRVSSTNINDNQNQNQYLGGGGDGGSGGGGGGCSTGAAALLALCGAAAVCLRSKKGR